MRINVSSIFYCGTDCVLKMHLTIAIRLSYDLFSKLSSLSCFENFPAIIPSSSDDNLAETIVLVVATGTAVSTSFTSDGSFWVNPSVVHHRRFFSLSSSSKLSCSF